MKRFEEFVVIDWKEWDNLGDGYQFGSCTLNPDFFVGEEETLSKINKMSSEHGVLPSVYFQFADTGFLIEIGLWKEDEEGEYQELGTWVYEGGITRGKSIPQD